MKMIGLLWIGSRMGVAIATLAILLASLAGPAIAQGLPIDPLAPDHIVKEPIETQSEGLEEVARTADTGVGEVGERTQVIFNADPTGRLNTRVQNRVQNRIRNRIDRNYDPTANATSPFEEADQESRRRATR